MLSLLEDSGVAQDHSLITHFRNGADTRGHRRTPSRRPSFQPLPQVFGLGATLDLLSEVGVDVIESRVLSLTARLAGGLTAKGFDVVGSQATHARSAILSLALRSDAERARMERGLHESGTTSALRESRVRLSPHFYNTEEEVDRLPGCL